MRKTLALTLGMIAVLILAACTLPATATPTPTQEDDVVICYRHPALADRFLTSRCNIPGHSRLWVLGLGLD